MDIEWRAEDYKFMILRKYPLFLELISELGGIIDLALFLTFFLYVYYRDRCYRKWIFGQVTPREVKDLINRRRVEVHPSYQSGGRGSKEAGSSYREIDVSQNRRREEQTKNREKEGFGSLDLNRRPLLGRQSGSRVMELRQNQKIRQIQRQQQETDQKEKIEPKREKEGEKEGEIEKKLKIKRIGEFKPKELNAPKKILRTENFRNSKNNKFLSEDLSKTEKKKLTFSSLQLPNQKPPKMLLSKEAEIDTVFLSEEPKTKQNHIEQSTESLETEYHYSLLQKMRKEDCEKLWKHVIENDMELVNLAKMSSQVDIFLESIIDQPFLKKLLDAVDVKAKEETYMSEKLPKKTLTLGVRNFVINERADDLGTKTIL